MSYFVDCLLESTRQKITSHNALRVIPHEGRPTLLRMGRAPRAPSVGQVLADSTRRHSKPEFEPKFVGNAGFSPDGVLGRHSTDQFPKVARQAASASRRLPPPEQAKAFLVPPDESVGLDHAKCTAPFKEPAQRKHDEPHAVCRPVRLRFALLEECELLTEEEISAANAARDRRHRARKRPRSASTARPVVARCDKAVIRPPAINRKASDLMWRDYRKLLDSRPD